MPSKLTPANRPDCARHFWVLLVVPAAVAVLALRTGDIWFKLGVPGTCALLLGVYASLFGLSHAGYVLAAFAWSMVGDYFLSNRDRYEAAFLLGIGAFFVAHLGYLGFAWRNGRPSWKALLLLLLVYLPFFSFFLNPTLKQPTLRVAVLLYLLISCASMSAAVGMRLPPAPRSLYIAGIALIVCSDTIISWREFLRYNQCDWLILPTYYLAHLCVTLSLLWQGRPWSGRDA